MNIYQKLNKMTKYIDDNLDQKINNQTLAKFLNVNVYTMNRLFSALTNLTISEYIRKRRLSVSLYDLWEKKMKIIDVAIKYQYTSATSFSRAFTKFYGFKPSLIKEDSTIKSFPRLIFDERVEFYKEFDYKIVSLDELILYGPSIKTTTLTIKSDAPIFFEKVTNKFNLKYGPIKYGMTTYDEYHLNCQRYFCLYDFKIDNYKPIRIEKSKWIKIPINSQNAKDIQKKVEEFYKKFFPSCPYNLKELPELEYYHDDVTDYLIPIY